jgi:acetyl-CoA synthase
VSKIIASAAIRGAHKIVDQSEQKWREAMDKWGPNEPVGFPNTAYYLPIIYGILGMKVEKLGDMEPVLKKSRAILPPPVKELHPLPYLAPALDAGMVTFFAEDFAEQLARVRVVIHDQDVDTRLGLRGFQCFVILSAQARHEEEERE